MLKKEYPKMIYKGGEECLGRLDVEHRVVDSYREHMMWLEAWGEKRPDDVAKPDKPVHDEEVKESVVENSEIKEPEAEEIVSEEKPRRRGRKPRKKG